jgi:hypothetical protein
MNFIKKHQKILVATILAAMLAVSLVVANQESTIMDEQAHIPAGYSYIKYHDMRLNPEHPPLLKDLAGIPLQFLNLKFPTDGTDWTSGVNAQWAVGNTFINSGANNADQINFWSRLPIILVGLLLGIFIFKWTKETAGTLAGFFALVLFAADPNILGHNHYVTTDLGIASFLFISMYFFVKFLKKPSWKNTALAGIFLGVAQLTKFSAPLFFPLFLLLLFVYVLSKKKPDFDLRTSLKYKWAAFWEYFGKFVILIIICFIAIWILYFFNTASMPSEKIREISNTVFGNIGAGKYAKIIVNQMSMIPLLKGLSEYFMGVFMVFARVEGGNTYYFFGHVTNQASKAYFPMVFLIKETIPFLVLALFSLGFAFFQFWKNLFAQTGNFLKRIWLIFTSYLQTGIAQYSMFLFVLLYAYMSITGNLDIGFRHLFPILPFAYFLISKKVFDFYRSIIHPHSKKTIGIIIAIFAVWIIAVPVIYFPSYISYFNEFVGGPKNGYKYVTDSNTDWGQDLKRLKIWYDQYNSKNPKNPIEKIHVDYFGGSNPKYYFEDNYIEWHGENKPETGWFAVSVGFMQESIHKQKPAGQYSYAWIADNFAPVARIGDSIFVFYVPQVPKNIQ